MANAITQVAIKDFLIFKGEFKADFCPGVNVIIGGNGSGKTTLLYATAMWSPIGHPYGPSEMYQASLDNLRRSVKVSRQEASKDTTEVEVFIPSNEMLSHPDILPYAQKYNSTFNTAELKTLSNAMLPVTNNITQNALKVLDKIKSIIGGEVVYENDAFFVVKEGIGKVSFSLEASGYRKLGLLWKLLRNGLLEDGSILFWDEPENSLNPELIPVVVDILLELQRGGVQVFAATHSYDIARWFELNKQSGDALRFFNLTNTENGIQEVHADDYVSLPTSIIDDADSKMLRKIAEVAARKAGVVLK